MEELMNCLVMADGTVLEASSCGYADKNLWCWVSGKTMPECFAIFNDPEKISEITVLYTTSGIRYKGFTDMITIRKGSDGLGNETVDVQLTWPEGGEHSIEEFPIIRRGEEEDEEQEEPDDEPSEEVEA